jgi:hypothetical protein
MMLILSTVLTGCLDNKSGPSGASPPPSVANVVSLTVDGGPSAATGQINHAYVSVQVCPPGSQSGCATIDHVELDTGSVGLRLVRSAMQAATLNLTANTDSQGQTVEECASFGGGDTWGPIAGADVTLAGEKASGVPVQILDDTSSGAAPPATCGANGTLINDVNSLGANGLLGVGVFLQDCGSACVAPQAPLPLYYGCTSAGVCTAENIALSGQVANVVAAFSSDNSGVLVKLPSLVNANGDATVQGELIFGIATQTDNALPATGLVVLTADGNGEFTTTYNGVALPSLIDSGNVDYAFDDANIPVCDTGAYVGFYCPAVAPQNLSAVNASAGSGGGATSTINFAILDPNSFVAGAAALGGLAGGRGSTRFSWGLPFFYGRNIYLGFEQRVSGSNTGPYYAY